MRSISLLLLLGLVACDPAEDTDKSDSGDTADTDNPDDTGDTEDTGDTADSGDSGDTAETGLTDDDGDGYAVEGGDCDDANPGVNPGAEEIWYDGVDQNCDGNDADQDGDGAAAAGFGGDDCNDTDAGIYVGAAETCDGLDQDCDGSIDEEAGGAYFLDADGDGYGDALNGIDGCDAAPGYVTNSDDCDDEDPLVNPAAVDECDGKDNDCDGSADEDSTTSPWYQDTDGDGHGDPDVYLAACYQPAGYVESWMDCDDTNADISPDAAELCNGVDDDCDGTVDPAESADAMSYYTDADGDAYGDDTTGVTACEQPADTVAVGGDCDDTSADVNPLAVESCNTIDDNCDGAVDEAGATGEGTWYTDADADGFGDADTAVVACDAAADQVADATDCDDTNDTVNPGATESCNGTDDNCDGSVDEGVTLVYYADVDLDGYGDASTATEACSTSTGWVEDSTDCDDSSASINPSALESCNGVDDNCDGATDEAGAVGEGDWYSDVDGDGYGDDSTLVTQCDSPAGAVSAGGDCDDAEAMTYPGAAELCDAVDQDCDGSITDEAGAVTWWDASGAATDVSAIFAAGALRDPATIGDAATSDLVFDEGSIVLCDGTYYARFAFSSATTDVTISSLNGAATTTLTGGASAGGKVGTLLSVSRATVSADGLTLTDASGISGSTGGAVAVSGDTAVSSTPQLTLSNSIVTGNETGYGGGVAVYNYGHLLLSDTSVEDNEATVAGGGFWIQSYGLLSCEVSALGAGGFVGNIAPRGGAGYLGKFNNGNVSSVGCDFGDDTAGDDNSLYDLTQNATTARNYCYPNAASLTDTVTCSGGNCTASTDTTCP